MKKLGVGFLFIATGLGILYWRYGMPRYTKLGETTFLKSENIEIKIVTRHEYLPLHYIGDAYSVACKSSATSLFKEWEYDLVEGGWNVIPPPVLQCRINDKIECDHQKLAEQAKPHFKIFDKMTVLVLQNEKLFVSFDGCKSFAAWTYKNLPENVEIRNSKEFDQCEEQKKRDKQLGLNSSALDCTPMNFLNDSQFNFDDIKANDSGYLSFNVHSPAIKSKEKLRVETTDFGKTWK